MGSEASKTKSLWSDFEVSILNGEGIDIGAGSDPVSETALAFDLGYGDANRADEYFDRQFDYVFSSHCLEHMHDPVNAFKRWWSLVKKGGYMIILVPDEDLYEQGYWPSVFNEDHKFTFTIDKSQSWSPVSINLRNLAMSVEGGEIIKIEIQDFGYDYSLAHKKKMSRKNVVKSLKWVKRISKLFALFNFDISRFMMKNIGLPVDQTNQSALAQIQLIMHKK